MLFQKLKWNYQIIFKCLHIFNWSIIDFQ